MDGSVLPGYICLVMLLLVTQKLRNDFQNSVLAFYNYAILSRLYIESGNPINESKEATKCLINISELFLKDDS